MTNKSEINNYLNSIINNREKYVELYEEYRAGRMPLATFIKELEKHYTSEQVDDILTELGIEEG